MPLDEDLARESQAGSLAAFEELVRRYETRIYRFLLQLCRNPADASELTQDTFVKAFQALASFNPRQSFGTWLFTIARRKCIDHHRSLARRAPALTEAPDLSVRPDPGEALAAREHAAAIWEIARRNVSPLQFQALWLRYAEDMSLSATARVLRKPETYVKVLLFRARQILSRKLHAERPCPARLNWTRSRTLGALGLSRGSLQQPNS